MPISFRFRPEWLLDNSEFSWRSALALVSACKAAYLPGDHAANLANGEWSMSAEPFDVEDSQGLILNNDQVTVIAFRGTDSTADWLGNLQILPRQVDAFNGSLHAGFLDAYDAVAPIIANAVESSQGRALWFTGHSLGGALALIAALTHRDREIAGLMTFGQPRLLGRRPAKLVNAQFGRNFQRFVNRNDIVTRVPPGYRHAGIRRHFTGMDSALDDPLAEEFDLMAESVDAGEDEDTTQLSETKFHEMQDQINAVREQIEAQTLEEDDFGIESAPIDQEELLETSVEGIVAGVSAHKIDAYLAEVNARAATEISLQGVHETFLARRSAQFSLEATIAEEPIDPEDENFAVEDFGVESFQEVEATYLVRLASQMWSPPDGVTLRSIVGNIGSVSATHRGVENMSSDPMVLSVDASREAGVEDVSVSVPHVKGTAIHTRPDLPEKGSEAIVGVIDTGIDILHEAFNDSDGNSRILGVWLQRDDTGPTPKDVDPAAFTQDYGTLYLAGDIEGFRQQHKDHGTAPPRGLRDELSGHGTHVASIAAGRKFADVGDGMAPEAKILVVSAHNSSDPDNPSEPNSIGYSASHVDALAFLKRASLGGTAVSQAAHPIAINVSLGMNAGAHDGQTTLEAAFDGVTGGGRDPGIVIVKSAGNERNHAGHASAQAALGAAVDIEWQTDDNARRRDYLEAWFEPGDDISFKLISPLNDEIGPVDFSHPDSSLEHNGNHFRLSLSEGHSDNGHNRLAITIEKRAQSILPGVWRLEMVGRQMFSRNGMVQIWAERVRQRSIRFLHPDRKMTLSVPGTANSVVTVGACNSEFPMKLLEMSSLGLTRDGRPKPELCAPGEMIVAARAADSTDAAVSKSGTSMAAPHVTGALALVFSAQTQAGVRHSNAVQLQQQLKHTTQNFSPIHNPGFGNGILDTEKLLSKMT
ncbi:S8 family serine peptidase [Ruegeria sp. 2205SS24-7]|uniref:S8 family serine peptidase n=1 Tax=Ruegeria discodermiae TaxID=3064389 RepID=UPI0027407695|nr:S8 family serine peptidase [Ruegeria sp. 2205SS24-7]MDP5215700.1 S8 family serine peptidase [Ruegeria sp. 2205SS24-7]